MSRQLLFSNGVEDKREKRMYDDTIAVSVTGIPYNLSVFHLISVYGTHIRTGFWRCCGCTPHNVRRTYRHTDIVTTTTSVMCYTLHRKISKECLENDENTYLKCNLVNFENPKWIYRLEMLLGSKTDKITFQTDVFIIFGTLYSYLLSM